MRNGATTVSAILAALLVAGGLWMTNRAVTPRQATWDQVLAEANAGGYRIITPDELAERYQAEIRSLFLVDTRQAWEYRTGHIPGAVNFPMEPTWWSRWHKASALESLLGPDKDRILVFY